MVLLSVIIPVYNVEKYLPRCLDSLLAQSFSDYEIILVNDGSKDNSLYICKKYEEKFNQIILVNQDNEGVSSARNNGVSQAQGEYVTFCDADDYIYGNYFNEINKLTFDSPDLLIFSYWNEFYSNKKIVKSEMKLKDCHYTNRSFFLKDFTKLFLTNGLYTVWNKVYKRDLLLQNNIYFDNLEVGEDTSFNLDVFKHTHNVKSSSQSFYHYIITRKDSATKGYSKKTMRYKIIELDNIKKFLASQSINDEQFMLDIKGTALNSLIDHIIFSENIKFSKKRLEIIKILNKETFENSFGENSKFNVFSKMLLSNKRISIYIILRKNYLRLFRSSYVSAL